MNDLVYLLVIFNPQPILSMDYAWNILLLWGTFTYYVIICDLWNLVPFGHKELWRPLAANRGSCDFKDVVASGHNQLWRPPVAKFRL